MDVKEVTRRARRWIARFFTVIGVMVPCLAVVGWLTFQHKPEWYRPAHLSTAGLRKARVDVINMVDYMGDRLVEGSPFDLELNDASVTQWFEVLPELYPEFLRLLPSGASEFAVRFLNDRIRMGWLHDVGGEAALNPQRGRWRVIAGTAIALHVSQDGQSLELMLRGVQGGSIPIPRFLLRSWLDPVLSSEAVNLRGFRLLSSTKLAYGLHSVDDLFEGVALENRFVWFNGNIPFRIESIAITDGTLRLRIRPILKR